jgi:Leucine-rich repeat (LRR) protein
MPADAVPELVCPITQQLFEDPVLLVEDGYTYERSAVTAWLEQNDTSPMSGAPLATKMLAPNMLVRQQADAVRREELPSDIMRTTEVTSLGGANQNVPDHSTLSTGLQIGVLLSWRARNDVLANRWPNNAPPTEWYGVRFDSSAPRRVTEINLGSTLLSGSIPQELGQLASLQTLQLEENQLSGSIRKELGQLASLRWLRLNNNQLSGSIPQELGQLASLQILQLDNNQLSGSIPQELGQLASLRRLCLNNNQLSGSIPQELGRLASLQKLVLDNNQLSGSIPEELRRFA